MTEFLFGLTVRHVAAMHCPEGMDEADMGTHKRWFADDKDSHHYSDQHLEGVSMDNHSFGSTVALRRQAGEQ